MHLYTYARIRTYTMAISGLRVCVVSRGVDVDGTFDIDGNFVDSDAVRLTVAHAISNRAALGKR